MAVSEEKNIYLVGPRACGKTTVGRMLAQSLGRPFVDLDDEFVETTGRTIADVVESEGWDSFRELETTVLAAVAATPGHVVATGGGATLKARNREILAEGVVVYLQADPEKVVERLMAELKPAQRPALTDLNLEDEVRKTVREREPYYLACAHLVAPDRPLEELAERLARELADWSE
ncbi:Shikimate kinase 2 [Fundidesulfovibrio magnetotacticus]|uniref:Shikimate kinase n=1 Tax=Fundidesulfovibrio magnetotacticus TaxID=2730080 RepID=A0A6V8LYK5_9BACT|nr:shikimate kinase AroL [Fundidesulfovibrio magnetotacticus]GFK95671.1 Shikimate kinase 2 [Fundidesulfovibrio magnetotacticus]